VSVRADWHLADLVLPEGDPMQEIAQLKSEATVIDVSRTSAVLLEELGETLAKENAYDHYSGLRCDLKWTAEGGERNPCRTCPHFEAKGSNPDSAMDLLCALGLEQETILDEYHALRALEALDAELAVSYESDVAACEEMAAALL
jgi:hypothetical protein